MGKPLSEDLRKRIIEFVKSGQSAQAAARQFLVAPRTAINLVNRWRATGQIAAFKAGRRTGSVLDAHQAWLREQVRQRSDLTLAELREGIMKRGVTVTEQAIWYYLERLGLSYKKSAARGRAGSSGRGEGKSRVEG
jgi:putative transposase